MRVVNLEDTFYFGVPARGTDGVPNALAGTPDLSAVELDASLGVIDTGITVAAHGSLTAFNIGTCIATAANGYERGKCYSVVIDAGTSDGVSVVGEGVYEFYVRTLAEEALTAYNDQMYLAKVVATTTGNTTGVVNLTDYLDAQTVDGDLVGSVWDYRRSATNQWQRFVVVSVSAARQFNVVVQADGSALDTAVAAGDYLTFIGWEALRATVPGRTLDTTATGAAGIDFGNVENPTTTVGLTNTTIATSQVVASVSGAVGSVTGAVGSVTGNVGGNVTGSVGSVVGAVGSVTGNVGGNVTGSVGSVAGAVGSVTGNVGGNVTGSVGSVATGGIASASFAAGAIDAAAIATGAVDADAIAADAVTEIQSGLATAANLATAVGYIDTEVASILAAVDTEVAAIITTLGTPAGVSVSADLADIEGKVDDLEGRVIGTIAAGTHNPQSGDAYARLGAPSGGSIAADLVTIMAQRSVPTKGSAFTFNFKMVDATDFATPETGLTVTATVSKDGAAFGAAGGTVTEIASGIYKFAASAADMNANYITFKFTATGAAATFVSMITDGGV